MPFKSKAQRRKFAQLLVEGKITDEQYEEWNRSTGRKELPERVTDVRKATKKPARKRPARKSAKKATPKKAAARKSSARQPSRRARKTGRPARRKSSA